MKPRNIIVGQLVDPGKVQRAKQLRKVMTPEERVLWARLRRNRVQGIHFRRQQVIDGFIVDFYCHQAGLVVEVDGPIHAEQAEYDADRDKIIQQRGLRILRFSNDDIRTRLSQVLESIELACLEGTKDASSTSGKQEA